jgi:hypothetical protein
VESAFAKTNNPAVVVAIEGDLEATLIRRIDFTAVSDKSVTDLRMAAELAN